MKFLKFALKVVLLLGSLFAALVGLSYLKEENETKYVDIYDDSEDEETAF